jgi:hypothetical protein
MHTAEHELFRCAHLGGMQIKETSDLPLEVPDFGRFIFVDRVYSIAWHTQGCTCQRSTHLQAHKQIPYLRNERTVDKEAGGYK